MSDSDVQAEGAKQDRVHPINCDKKKASVLPDGTVPSVKSLKRKVPPARFERTTPGLGIRCSIQLSYEGKNETDAGQTREGNGHPSRIL